MSPIVLFDLDGTLTDPREGILRSIGYALEKMGIDPPPFSELEWTIGPPLRPSLAKLLRSENPEVSAECLSHYRERFSSIGLFENVVYDGIPEALNELTILGHRVFIATSKPTAYAVRIAEHLRLAPYLEDVFGSEMDGTRSDKGDLLEYVLGTIELGTADAVMVGDRIHDLAGARRNGLIFLGAAYGFARPGELSGSDAIVNSPREIPKTIGRLFGPFSASF